MKPLPKLEREPSQLGIYRVIILLNVYGEMLWGGVGEQCPPPPHTDFFWKALECNKALWVVLREDGIMLEFFI